MTADESGRAPAGTTAVLGRFRDAFVTRNMDDFRALLTEDAVVHSPYLTPENFVFTGRDQSCLAVWALFHHMDGFTVTEEFAGENAVSIFFTARLDGHPVSGALLSRVDGNGLIYRGDLLLQDIMGLSRFAQAIAPELLRPESRVLAALAWLPSRLLTAVLHRFDQVACLLLSRTADRTAARLATLPRPDRSSPGGS